MLYSAVAILVGFGSALLTEAAPLTDQGRISTLDSFTFTGYSMQKPDGPIIDWLSLEDGLLTSALGVRLQFDANSGYAEFFSPQAPEVTSSENTGRFEICTRDNDQVLEYLPTPSATDPIKEFKICQVDSFYMVYFPDADTRGLSCVSDTLKITSRTTPRGSVPDDLDASPYPLHLTVESSRAGLTAYGSHRSRHLSQRSTATVEVQEGLFVHAASKQVTTPRPAKAHSIVIGTMIKNKGQYLKEWIEFHLMVGVNHFLFYDHESTDSTRTVLAPYIASGAVTYVSWPESAIASPAPSAMATGDVEAQRVVYERALDACKSKEWKTHTQGACQFAASIDMIRRTQGSAEWLGFFDVDEFVYPTSSAMSKNLQIMFGQAPFKDADYISVLGSNFGTSGHKSTPSGLVTESYHHRRALHSTEQSPFSRGREAFLSQAQVDGRFPQTFTLPDTYARKAFVRPELALYSTVHDWVQRPSATQAWNEVSISLTFPHIKMNHYAYLSAEDANTKAQVNGNPMAAYDAEQDAYYNAEEDREVAWLINDLKARLTSH